MVYHSSVARILQQYYLTSTCGIANLTLIIVIIKLFKSSYTVTLTKGIPYAVITLDLLKFGGYFTSYK